MGAGGGVRMGGAGINRGAVAGSGRFAGNNRNGWRGRGWRGRGYGRGFGAGFATGALIGGASYGYGYGGPYYDDYSYGVYDDDVYAAEPAGSSDDAYCSQRFRSYDPASGTYLGYDGIRHPCP